MREIAKIKTYLMKKELAIARFEISIYERFVEIDKYVAINGEDCPPIISKIGILQWLLSRCMSYTVHWQAYLIDAILQDGDRNKYAPFILSLNTNSTSISDWYWLQPEENMEFEYGEQLVSFCVTSWNAANWHKNQENVNTFNSCINKDIFEWGKFVSPVRSPIFTINGTSHNQFFIQNGEMFIKQRKTKSKIDNDVRCLSFFENRGVLVPAYQVDFEYVEDRDTEDGHIYLETTRENGMFFITKRILTSNSNCLAPLIWFYQDKCVKSMCDMIDRIELSNGINVINKGACQFVDEFKDQFSTNEINGTNIGLLIDEEKNAILTVWGDIAI
jgi:hypothetical protein